MNVIGHVSVAQLLAWAPGQRFNSLQSFWVIAGALLPDIIDKSIMFLGIYPWGRTVGHSIFFWIVLALVTLLFIGRGKGRWMSWLAVGGASHLLMDFLDDIVGGLHYTGYVFSAWFTWPLLNPDLFPIRVVPLFCETPMHGLYTVAEAFAVALVLNRAAQELPSDQSQIRG